MPHMNNLSSSVFRFPWFPPWSFCGRGRRRLEGITRWGVPDHRPVLLRDLFIYVRPKATVMGFHRRPDLSANMTAFLDDDILNNSKRGRPYYCRPIGTGLALPTPVVVSSVTQPLRVAGRPPGSTGATRNAYPNPPRTHWWNLMPDFLGARENVMMDGHERLVELYSVIQFFNSHCTETEEPSPAQLKAWVRWIYTYVCVRKRSSDPDQTQVVIPPV